MKVSRITVLICGALFFFNSLVGQVVYPVFNSASMAAPFSNNLNDYAGNLSQNLTFVFTLKDPIESSVDVYFRLTIKNNGKVIMKTKSNFTSSMVTLLKRVPYMVNGSQISDLLNVQNLEGVNGYMASNILPNGQNQLCLEAYSVLKKIPISLSACGISFYNKIDVAVLELPACNSNLDVSTTNQNIFFKWAPRHIGSKNVPAMIQYEFDLVELPIRYDNLQDGFTRGTRIAKKTVSATNVYYTNVDPRLETDKKYVWRVRVFDPMGTDVFKNRGYSEYCEFSLKSRSELAVPSCSSGQTSVPSFTSEQKTAKPLYKNDIVKLGYFDMKLTELTAAGTGYNGEATIAVPFLKAVVPVTFAGLQANKDQRVYQVESIKAKIDVETQLSTLTKNTDNNTKDKAIAKSIKQLIQANPTTRMTMNRTSSDKTPIGLPLIIAEKDGNGKSLPSIIIFGMEFGINDTKISAAISSNTSNDSSKANYIGFDIPTVPGGIAPNQMLDLVSDLNLTMGLGGSIVIRQNSPEANATKAKIGCEGFQEFNMKGKYTFPNNFINNADVNQPLIADFIVRTKNWNETILQLTNVNEFGLAGLTDFKFKFDNAFFDVSSSNNESSMVFPDGYAGTKENWKGVYIPSVKVELPKSLTGDNVKNFESKNFLLDQEGIHTKLVGSNVLGITEGSLGGWAVSMDTIVIELQKNALVNSKFVGGLQIPIMKGDEVMPYVASLSMPAGSKTYDMDFKAIPKSVSIELLGANVEFSKDSEITVGRKDGKFVAPKVKMSGKVIFDFSPKGMVGKSALAYKQVEKLFQDNNLGSLVPKFKSEGFDFNNFIFDANRPNNKFTIDNIKANKTSIQFLGIAADLGAVEFKPVDRKDLDSLVVAKLGSEDKVIGLSFQTKIAENVLGGLAPTVFLGLNIKESTLADSSSVYAFLNYDVKMKAPQVDAKCSSEMEPVAISSTTPYSGDSKDLKAIKVGRFTMTPDMSTMTASGSTYSGIGIIEVPVLGPMRKLRVKFTNIKINAEKQFTSGSIATESGKNGLIESLDVKGLLGDAMKNLNEQANSIVKLPVIMGDPAKDGYSFTIVGLEFTPTKTSLAARLIVDIGNGKYAEFKAAGLDIVPTGITGVDLRLSLDKTLSLAGSSMDIPLSLDAYNESEKSGSYVLCDCDGFNSFNLSGAINLSTDYVKSIKGKTNSSLEQVTGKFSMNAEKWGDFMGNITINDTVYIPGLEDMPMYLSAAEFDYSNDRNPKGLKLEGPNADTTKNWKGVYIPTLSMKLPPSLTASKNVGSITGNDLIFTNEGFTGKINGLNVVDIKAGSIGGWAMSIDTVNINLAKNSLVNSMMVGGMQIPIMKDDEVMPYTAKIFIPDGSKTYDVDFKAVPKKVSVELLGANIEFSKDSEITVGRKDGKFVAPKLKMSGKVVFDFSPKGMVGKSAQAYKEVEKLFKDNGLGDMVPKFKSEGFDFTNFIFDANRPKNKFTIDNIKANKTRIEFLGTGADLSAIAFQPVDRKDLDSLVVAKLKADDKVIGLSFETKVAADVLGGLAPTVFLGLNMKESLLPDSSSVYSFLNFDIKMQAPDVDMGCNNNLKPVAISSTTPYSGGVSDLKEIKVGRFTLKPDMSNMTTSGSAYSGTGIIEVPVLGPMRKLRVKFTDIKINAEKQYTSGTIATESGKDGLIQSPDVKGLLGDAMKSFNSLANSAVKLPVIMGDPAKDGYAFTIVGLEFTPTKTSLVARLIVDLGNDRYAEFKAGGLNIVPTGIAGVDLRMSLDKTLSLAGSSMDIPLSLDAYNDSEKTGSYVLCDCDGFNSFNLSGAINLSTDYVKSSKGKTNSSLEQVTGKFSMNAEKWGDFMGNITINDTVYIPGLEDMPMYLSEAEFDYSNDRNPKGLKLEGANADTTKNWKGVYISTMSLKLPEAITSTTSDAVAMVTGNDLIFDAKGFSGRFKATNLISSDKANIGGFGFSLDSIIVALKENGLEESKFEGGIKLPIMDDDEFIPYDAKMFIGHDTVANKKYLDFNFAAKPGVVKIDMLKSTFDFDSTSSISITRKFGKFQYPIVDLSGKFKIEIPDLKKMVGDDFNDLANLLKEHLGVENAIPEFKLDNIAFKHFKINPNDSVAFSIESITPNGVGIKFMSLDWNMEKIEFNEMKKLVDEAKEGLKKTTVKEGVTELALEFNFGKAPLSADLKIKINEEKLNDNKLKYKYAGIDFKLNLPSIPKFKCELPDSVAAIEATSGAIAVGDIVKVGGFKMKIKELADKKGKGTIKIDFLNYDMEVTFDRLNVNAKKEMLDGVVLSATDKSLIPDDVASTAGNKVPFIDGSKIKDIAAKTQSVFTLPISIAAKLKEVAGLELPKGLDIIVVGLSFSKTGGQMNLVISTPSPIQGQDPIQFGIRGLNIRPEGMNLGDLKLFLAQNVQF